MNDKIILQSQHPQEFINRLEKPKTLVNYPKTLSITENAYILSFDNTQDIKLILNGESYYYEYNFEPTELIYLTKPVTGMCVLYGDLTQMITLLKNYYNPINLTIDKQNNKLIIEDFETKQLLFEQQIYTFNHSMKPLKPITTPLQNNQENNTQQPIYRLGGLNHKHMKEFINAIKLITKVTPSKGLIEAETLLWISGTYNKQTLNILTPNIKMGSIYTIFINIPGLSIPKTIKNRYPFDSTTLKDICTIIGKTKVKEEPIWNITIYPTIGLSFNNQNKEKLICYIGTIEKTTQNAIMGVCTGIAKQSLKATHTYKTFTKEEFLDYPYKKNDNNLLTYNNLIVSAGTIANLKTSKTILKSNVTLKAPKIINTIYKNIPTIATLEYNISDTIKIIGYIPGNIITTQQTN